MKKFLFLLIILFPLLSCAQFDDLSKTDWQKDGLKGKVKKVTLTSDNAVSVTTYNSLGYIIEIENDHYPAKQKRTYDSTRILLSEKFDNKGNCTSRAQYEYDNQGLLVTYIEHSEFAQLVGHCEYNSDKTIKSITYFEEDTVQYYFLVEYEYQNGVLVEEKQFGSNRSPYIWIAYNENGQYAEYKKWKGDGTLRIHGRYIYDDNGSLVRWDEKLDGEWKVYCSYENDEHGNVITEKTFEGDGVRIKNYKYVYDDQGNWTEKDERLDSEPNSHWTETRIIEYY